MVDRKLERVRTRTRALLVAKVLLLTTFLFATNQGIVDRIISIGWQLGLLVFLTVWLLSIAALLLVAFSPSFKARMFWSFAFGVVAFFGLTFQKITASYLSYSEVERLVGLIGFVDDVLAFYVGILASAAGWSVLGVVAILMPPCAVSHLHRWPMWTAFASAGLLQVVPVTAIASILYLRGGEGTDGFPIQYSGMAFLSVLGIETALSDRPKVRRDVTLNPNRTKGVRHVVLVIDESVRGDLLDINSAHGVETGLLSADLPVVNFGVASSTANCSEASNVSVRMGLTRRNYLKELHSNPPIWAYAKRAGYRTAYFDGQRNGGNLQNHMDQQELQLIDDFVQLEANIPPHQRDFLLARKLRTLLETSSLPQFILVNKMGAHFPYEGKYPSSDAIYKPTMAANYFGTEADPRGLGTDLDESADSRRRYKNSYLNAIRWNIRQFFGALLPGLDLADTIIIYTADHGQDLHEDGRPGYATHCTGGLAPAAEGSVPLAILTNHARLLPSLRKAALENADNASQFNVFPTLLLFMGFEPDDLKVTDGFEPSLFEVLPKGNQQFLSTFYVRFGRTPVWNPISTRH